MNTKKSGTFYGVGVGPGDPELLTLKSLKVLKGASTIAVPRSSNNSAGGKGGEGGEGLAFSIVKRAVDLDGKNIMELNFPMTKDNGALKEAREEAALRVVESLKSSGDVAFVTLGDPMFYSTFSYLVPVVKKFMPEAKIEVVPGVSAVNAATSLACIPLAESDERVFIIPAVYNLDEVRRAIESYDTVVLMKVKSVFDELIELIEGKGLAEKTVFIQRAGWPEQVVIRDIKNLKVKAIDYFSMLIVKKRL